MIYYLAAIYEFGSPEFSKIVEEKGFLDWLSQYSSHIGILGSFVTPRALAPHFPVLKQARKFVRVMIDSGGYSFRGGALAAHNKRERWPSVGKYASYVRWVREQLPNEAELVYLNFDTLDPLATIRNQEFLESLGLLPVPVYHMDEWGSEETRGILEEYRKRYRYIAIAGGSRLFWERRSQAADQREQMRRYYDYCFSTCPPPEVKLHGLGVSAWHWHWRYPFYSCDNTGWFNVIRWGTETVREFGSGPVRTRHWRSVAEKVRQKEGLDEDDWGLYVGRLRKDVLARLFQGRQNATRVQADHVFRVVDVLVRYSQEVAAYWQKRGVVWS